MPGPALPRVDIAGVMAVDMAEGPGQPVAILRHGDDMNMVGHQAIAPDLDMRPPCRLGEQIEVEPVIAILEEGITVTRAITP